MEADTTNPGMVVDDRFVLRSRLGQGGAATVWLADDPTTGGDVALKLIHAHLRDNRQALSRFGREAEVLVGLDHPHIARCYAYRLDSARPYLAIEHVMGHSLKQEIGARAGVGRHFTTELLGRLFSELSAAVTHAHERGVLHRDLNPANVLLDTTQDAMSVRVVDFGVAKLLHNDEAHATTHGRVIGTPASIAPEQALGEEIDHRADIFALGVILFEMLTLRRAFMLDMSFERLPAYDGPTPTYKHNAPLEVFDRIVNGPRPKPSEERPEIPQSLSDVVVKALAIDKEARFATVAEMADALAEALAGVSLAADDTFVLERRRGSTIAPPSDPSGNTAVVPRRASSVADAAPTPIVTQPDVVDVAPTVVPQVIDPTVTVEPPAPLRSVSILRSPDPMFPRFIVPIVCFLAGVVVTALVLAPKSPEPPVSVPVPAESPSPGIQPRAAPTPAPEESAAPAPPPPSPAPPPRARRAKRIAKKAPPPAAPVAPAPARFPKLRSLLARVKNNPGDAKAIGDLAAGLEAAAKSVPDASARARIVRLASTADVSSDPASGFAKALRLLEKSTP